MRGFVSYKDEPEVSRKIHDLCYQLEVMMQRKPDEAKVIGKELIEKLLHVETDDDTFPIFNTQSLYELIGEEKSYEEVADLYLANMEWREVL